MTMTEKVVYSADFYAIVNSTASRSARQVVPLVLEYLHPESVVDVGCGTGVWLANFASLGVPDFFGMDGHWVDRASLCIPASAFQVVNLQEPITLGRRFDLVVSLEVGEHLPQASAETFVTTLTNLGHVILFSAAIPEQQGFLHVNEQWPAYWAELFRKRNYVAIDCLRTRLWENPSVDWWYAQNMMFFVDADQLKNYPLLQQECTERTSRQPQALVHPELFLYRSKQAALTPAYQPLTDVVKALPWLVQYELRKNKGYVKVRQGIGKVWQTLRRS